MSQWAQATGTSIRSPKAEATAQHSTVPACVADRCPHGPWRARRARRAMRRLSLPRRISRACGLPIGKHACMHACHCHAIVSLSPTETESREEAQNQKPLLPLMNRAIPPSLSLLESLELNESSRPFSRPSGQAKVAKQQCRHFLGLRSSPASACTPHRLLHHRCTALPLSHAACTY